MSDHRLKSHGNLNHVDTLQRASKILNVITSLLNARKNKILLVAESSLQASQFKAFRQLFLDEFGKNGLESDLVQVLVNDNDVSNTGVERAGTDYAGKEVPK